MIHSNSNIADSVSDKNFTCCHHLDIYPDDEAFINNLTVYLSQGIIAGENIVVIATDDHLAKVCSNLRWLHPEFDKLVGEDKIITLSTSEAIATFVSDGWPNEDLFIEFAYDLLKRMGGRDQKIRAYGEIVAVLCREGLGDAALRLECLWDKFCRLSGIELLCAYPKEIFDDLDKDLTERIIKAHSNLWKNNKAH